ncbi:unnamed protein product [Lymnaea stagnalis]|uniref:Tetratricopeptide repeat protein 1 n=1 Tax=Lymnaea stagnalis TaxID=6523 RepID=A0AAV2IL73_LYMST
MASHEKGQGDAEPDESVPPQEDYIHNPEEFIDIHGRQRTKKLHLTDNENAELEKSSSLSASMLHSIQDLKVPVQVSEESDLKENPEETSGAKVIEESISSSDPAEKVTEKVRADESDSEYQSADDGEEEDESDDEFIPVGDEDDCHYREEFSEKGAFSTYDETNDNESCEDSDKEEKELDLVDDLDVRKKIEEQLTEDEKLERKTKSQLIKDEGNIKFRQGDFDDAVAAYTEALEICPLIFHKERSVMFANRAACKMKQELYDDAINDSTRALEIHPHYLKALLRRAELYEKTSKLDEALKDYQDVLQLDPSHQMARASCMKLAEKIKERNEKMKEEMIGKLKDLGNLVLRPFGLSVNNFNLQQDPTTGSYSVQFQQKPNNGS